MRFLLDEDLPPEVAAIAAGHGLDVVSVHVLRRTGLSDDVQLRFSAAEGRIFVTRNRDDFIRLTRDAFATNQPHHGVLVVSRAYPNHRPAAVADALLRWAARYEAAGPGQGFLDFL